MGVMKIKSTDVESQGPFVIIDDSDFNSEIHEVYDEGLQQKEAGETTEEVTKKRGRPTKSVESEGETE